MTQNFHSSRSFVIFYEFSVRMAQILFSLNYRSIHPLILQVTSVLKQWKTSKRSSTTLRYMSRSLPKILHYLANNICQSLIKLCFLQVSLWEWSKDYSVSVFGLWPRVFFFIKARYQNAEEVLKQRWVLHGFSFVSVLVLACWALWLVQNVHALSRLWSYSEKQSDQAPACRKPRKPSRPAKPVYLYRITESCIHLKRLVWREPLFICEWKTL